ncbi:MAG: fumarylacetoacetate hydrolase family protein [Eubacteriales bacterium]|nr:fumarylacetoacetate hydrolase family protein [Eubacteriales bacterium]
MKLITFEKDGRELAGVLSRNERFVLPVSSLGLPYESMQELICGLTAAERQLLSDAAAGQDGQGLPVESVRLLAPIPCPAQDVICLGINYMDHADEASRYKADAFGGERPYPIYFSKRVNRAVADHEPIPAHENLVDSLDYECELAVIIGRDTKNVSEEEAADCIFGYTILNDVSARNVQTRHKQWYFGKSLDGFTPMGPCILTDDEVAFPPKLSVRSRVNGELRQNSTTELLIFGVAHVISELSSGMTLKAGTIIATGTPAGVGMGFTPPRFLHPGDVVECSIEGIGSLTNPVH